MAETGAGGLSLGEVARRMDMGTPSLYQYFPSEHAVYDEGFARGWRELEAHMRALDERAGPVDSPQEARALLRDRAVAFVRWALSPPLIPLLTAMFFDIYATPTT